MRLIRALVILLSMVFVALLLRQADVFTHSTTAKHRSRQKKAPDPNVLIAEQKLRGNRMRIAFDLDLLKGDSSTGTLVLELMEDWAPIGVKHFQELMEASFYDEVRFFRVVPNFVAQFGISGDPEVQRIWRKKKLTDDPVKNPNERGTITYATSGKDTRTTQLFINLKDNNHLDDEGFAPFARIVSGLELIDQIQDMYREKPEQGQIQQRGNAYLQESFPELSFIRKARIL